MNKIVTTSLLACGLIASAQAVNLTINGMAPGLHEVVTINYNGQNRNVYAGAQSVSVDGASPINLYCIDLDHGNQAGYNYNANIIGVGSVSSGTLIANLFSHEWTGVNNSVEAAAFQLALWDIVTDGADGLAVGNFKATGTSSAIATQTAHYLDQSATAGPEALFLQVYEATNHGPNGDRFQDLIGAEAVPEPISLFAVGAIAAAVIRRKRK
jgi:hypothetical protein